MTGRAVWGNVVGFGSNRQIAENEPGKPRELNHFAQRLVSILF
jgi:hypothetical protein